MIGNKYLQKLYDYPDVDTSLNQLLELLKTKDSTFIDSLWEPMDINLCDDKELSYLTIASALIDYYLQIQGFEVPAWLREEKLSFSKPYYHSKRISDFDKFKLLYSNPAPFRARNVYFDLAGIDRV
ncbi:hypothetical protein F9B85_04310 [Heliorestis acidaminivorans]|uniref:Uncharacterized protein n=1 Tax=Heliorestis acidaminivorans TaxID=553427 RepID=A0A6I0EUH3_9FIRM|nr:hypothetical protein [Heliorestis acidaminivorans]KAB2953844.1 hypothetical protein F9B85_04310 [Heliorestis acidaminivorans]